MNRKDSFTTAIVCLLGIGLVGLVAGTAVAQPPGGQGPPSFTPSHPTGPQSSHPSGPQNQTDHGAANQSHGPGDAQRPGRLEVDNGTVDGRYVAFSFDEAAGTLTAYTVGGTEYFAQVRAPGSFEAQARGASVSFEGDDFVIAVHDNPTGLLRIRANNTTTVQLGLAAGVEAVANGSRIDVKAGNASAFVTNATLSGSDLVVGHGLFLQRGATVAATAKANSPAESKIEEAIAAGHVAARAHVLSEGTDVLAFDDAHMQARKSANGSHRFIVDANLTEGRAFVVDFAPGLLKAGELGVLYYDEVNGTLEPAMIQRAASLEDVLDLQPGEAPKYWAIEDLAGHHVVVAVPHFSVHAFDVYSIGVTPSAMIGVGLVAAVALVAVLAVGAYVGRREKD